MAFTSHGHQIPNTLVEADGPPLARCGGLRLCKVCQQDAADYVFMARPGLPQKPLVQKEQIVHPILVHFEYNHLPPNLQEVSKHFCDLAYRLDLVLPNGPEKSVALRKLLEGKDAAVRSARDVG